MENPFFSTVFLVLIMITNLTTATVPICPQRSAKDYILGFRSRAFTDESGLIPPRFSSVTKGDDVWLEMASDLLHKNKCDYVALLFYATWCPFSISLRPTFDVISLLYPSVPHFAIEESSVKASTISKYGVHGFPTIFLLNSTMRVAYRGSRTLDSLVAFYGDVTGTEPLDETLVEINGLVPLHVRNKSNTERENCPVPWAKRSPENLFRQETYLALATIFVSLRLLHLIFPTLAVLARYTWRLLAQNTRRGNLLERTVAMYLNEPCVSSNLQEGAMNARAWASKSLATVSIGDSSSSNRGVSASQ